MAPLHGKNRLWRCTFPLLSLQICGSSRCCGLSGQCLWQQWHTQLFSCLRLPCVTSCKKSSEKDESLNGSLAKCWSKTSRFYSEPFLTSLSLSACGRGGKENKRELLMYVCTAACRCVWQKKKCLHINLFGRNDKNRRVWGWCAEYDCQVTQIQQ